MRIIYIILIATFSNGFLLQAQDQTIVLTKSEKEQVVERICILLQRFYVVPDVALQMEEHITLKLAEGAFKRIADKVEFIDILNNELHSICPDKHLGIYLGPNPDEQTDDDRNLQRIINQFDDQKNNYGISKVEIMEGNVGYLKINSVMFSKEAMEILSSAMQFLSNTNAIIFDLRENRGGDPDYMAYLFSYFFEKPIHINDIYWRDRDRTDEFWTHDSIPGKKMVDLPLYVLISSKTFSGAEEFAYDLQALNRATIIGEVSAGGANPASTWVVYNDIRISIPFGRAINPITGTNWEGTGVKPDIETSAIMALEVAIEYAKKSAEDYYALRKSNLITNYNKLKSDLVKAEKLINEYSFEEAEEIIITSLMKAIELELMNQSAINRLGYDYLDQEKNQLAIAIFKTNVISYPESADVYDSLGEAYLENGEKQLAVLNYKKVLEIDPNYPSAIRALKEIEK